MFVVIFELAHLLKVPLLHSSDVLGDISQLERQAIAHVLPNGLIHLVLHGKALHLLQHVLRLSYLVEDVSVGVMNRARHAIIILEHLIHPLIIQPLKLLDVFLHLVDQIFHCFLAIDPHWRQALIRRHPIHIPGVLPVKTLLLAIQQLL